MNKTTPREKTIIKLMEMVIDTLKYCDDLDDPNLYSPDIHIATTALNQAIEQMINRLPEEYMWGYKRFKGAPNLPNFYAH